MRMKIDGHWEWHPNLSVPPVSAIRGRSGQIKGYFLRNQRNEHLLSGTRKYFTTDQDKKNKCWKKEFQELLNPDITLDELPPLSCNIFLFVDLPLIALDIEEIIRSLSKLKNHKSLGVYGISNELLKYDGESSVAFYLFIYLFIYLFFL